MDCDGFIIIKKTLKMSEINKEINCYYIMGYSKSVY